MSVVNLAVMPDRILMLTDTLVYRNGKPVSLCERKAAISKAGGFVSASRGTVWLQQRLHEVNDTFPDMDEALRFWRMQLPLLEQKFHGDHGSSIFIAGHSPSLGGLSAVRILTEFNGGEPVITEQVLGHGIHLYPELTGKVEAMLPKAADETMMQRLTLAQWKVQGKLGIPLCVGGGMWLLEITAEGATERLMSTYPDYHVHAARFGDPNAELVAALVQQKAA